MDDNNNATGVEKTITVTSDAVKEIKRLLTLENDKNLFLRVGVTSGGCSGLSYQMALDSERSEFDREFVFDGLQVMVDLKALPHIAGSVLDYKGGMLGGGFQFSNPNAKRSCGCGSSFSC